MGPHSTAKPQTIRPSRPPPHDRDPPVPPPPESGRPPWAALANCESDEHTISLVPPPRTDRETFMTKHKQFRRPCSRQTTSGSKSSLRAYATPFSDRPGAAPAAAYRKGARKRPGTRSDTMHTGSASAEAGRRRGQTRRWRRVPIPAHLPIAFVRQSDIPGSHPPRKLTKTKAEWRRSARRRRDAIVQVVRTSDVAGVHQPQNRPNGAVALTRGRPRLCQMPSGASTRVDDER